MLDLKHQLDDYRNDAIHAFNRVMESQQFILGEEVALFEDELQKYLGDPDLHCVGVSSGSDALLMALMDFGVGPGCEVVTTPFTFFATAEAIARLDARPVFADINPQSFNLDDQSACEAVTPNTTAIIPVHLFGQLGAQTELYKTGVPVVEDGAQAIGAKHGAVGLGKLGDYATLSFFPSKNLGGFGDGGAVLCHSPRRASRLRALRTHGSVGGNYLHERIGGNFRLDALQAAILSEKLRHLKKWTGWRQFNANVYDVAFEESGLLEEGFLETPWRHDWANHVFNQYVIRVTGGRRDGLKDYLASLGIETRIYYPTPLHLQPCFRYLGYARGDFPHAELACDQVLALPVAPHVQTNDVHEIVNAIKAFFFAGARVPR
ncbi:MAG: DegT/DnrJ/EryC1/StrS family aminotransferase [Actinomycetales bacterium]|nr:DegT/DnrJ/EryC1/StrS family aminotransferase [Actinomycetales bacterium]